MPELSSMADIVIKDYSELNEKLLGEKSSSIAGENIKKAVSEAVEDMEELLRTHIGRYYASYSPSRYGRTGGLRDSVFGYVGLGGVTGIVSFTDFATHPSVFGQGAGYTPALINDGWQVGQDKWFSGIPHFGYYEGSHFVENAVSDFKAAHPEFEVTVKK